MTTTATPASNSRAPESSLAAVERVFSWFNNLGTRRIPLNRSDIDRHFTPDLKLMIDMKVMAGGLDAMAQRMTEMLSKTEWWSVAPLPFEMALSENDLASAYYQYRFVDNEKQTNAPLLGAKRAAR
jgi:hypothetical protein